MQMGSDDLLDAQNVADRFDGMLNPDNAINKEVLGLAQPGPLLGVLRV